MDPSDAQVEPVRVCHVVNAYGESTGPANHAVALSKHTNLDLSLLGWFKGGAFDEMSRIRTFTLNAPDGVLGMDWSTLCEAKEILSSHHLIHTHHPHSATFAKLIARKLDIPSVFTYGTDPSKYTTKGRLANGLTNRFANRVTCVSPAVRDALAPWERRLCGGNSIEVVYTGVDLELIEVSGVDWDVRDAAGIPADAPLVGHAGRLMEAKDQGTLIRGVAKASELLDETVHLAIAGDGELLNNLKNVASAAGVDDTVTFLGFIPRNHTYRMMADVDVFAMPSKWEGFSSAALEAMALGTACVFSDISAFREPFSEVAAFHPVGDPDALGQQLASLLTDDAYRSRISDAAEQLVREKYTMKSTAKRYADIYGQLLDSR